MMLRALPDGLRDAPPSAKLCYHALDAADSPLSREELGEQTGLHPNTLSRALSMLVKNDFASRGVGDDLRRREYILVEESGGS